VSIWQCEKGKTPYQQPKDSRFFRQAFPQNTFPATISTFIGTVTLFLLLMVCKFLAVPDARCAGGSSLNHCRGLRIIKFPASMSANYISGNITIP